MSQGTLGDDDPLGETAAEMRTDVEKHLGEVQPALPDPDDVWEADADNVLGVLNDLCSSPDAESAARHVRQAKEWYVISQRAETFDDPEDLETAIGELETPIEMVEKAHELVGELTNTMPQFRGALANAAETAEAASVNKDEDEDEEEE